VQITHVQDVALLSRSHRRAVVVIVTPSESLRRRHRAVVIVAPLLRRELVLSRRPSCVESLRRRGVVTERRRAVVFAGRQTRAAGTVDARDGTDERTPAAGSCRRPTDARPGQRMSPIRDSKNLI
jgi:hypothetical protein